MMMREAGTDRVGEGLKKLFFSREKAFPVIYNIVLSEL